MLVLKDAIGVDGEGVGNGGNGEHLCNRTGNAAVAVLRPSHFILCDDEKDDPAKFTRTWFAWANTWFGELIVKLNEKWPNLSNGVSETAD